MPNTGLGNIVVFSAQSNLQKLVYCPYFTEEGVQRGKARTTVSSKQWSEDLKGVWGSVAQDPCLPAPVVRASRMSLSRYFRAVEH